MPVLALLCEQNGFWCCRWRASVERAGQPCPRLGLKLWALLLTSCFLAWDRAGQGAGAAPPASKFASSQSRVQGLSRVDASGCAWAAQARCRAPRRRTAHLRTPRWRRWSAPRCAACPAAPSSMNCLARAPARGPARATRRAATWAPRAAAAAGGPWWTARGAPGGQGGRAAAAHRAHAAAQRTGLRRDFRRWAPNHKEL